ncbi:Na/Pi cotransporter family protein [Treponema primitia]|uniref:Na/Pi cotransporter family protein n=1 Tax=Treponema primitia TaxID=88058 RepID=UPI00397EB6B3
MDYIRIVFRIIGGLCLFLYGMKVMSDGVQQAAGDRMQRVLNFMTKNRFVGVLTGMAVTALVQSSSAVSVMLVSFVNAGLLTLTQAIGVIMGANIGTTTTAWIVSLIGFQIDISALALPAIGIGFFMGAAKWKYQDLGGAFLGFGFLFLGLQFLTNALPAVNPESMEFIRKISDLGFLSVIIGMAIGTAVTLLMHSSAATITLVITLAFREVINFEISAAMILGANIGTTIDAIMAAIGTKTAAKQTALVHVLFNVVGSIIALIFFRPLVLLVNFLVPGSPEGAGIATHLAMFHTVFNILGTLVFLPFVHQFAALVSFLIKDKDGKQGMPKPYRLEYQHSVRSTPDLNIIRAEKEIRDMTGLASSMFAGVSKVLSGFREEGDKTAAVDALVTEMKDKEEYADEMRVELTRFLLECTRQQLSHQSEEKVYQLLRIISDLEDMTDDCYSVSLLLDRSVKKNLRFKNKEMEALAPYVAQVEDFLSFVKGHVGRSITEEQAVFAEQLENAVDKSRDKLRKLGRKRIEAGEDVKTELLFIDVVRRIEKVGDYCYNIAESLMRS